jgi:AAA domain
MGGVQGPNGNGPNVYTESILRRAIKGKWTTERVIEELREEELKTLPSIISAHDLCANPPPTPTEIIEDVLHQGSKFELAGGSKSLKTWTLLQLAICVAMGLDWLGFSTAAGRVLYVNFELPEFSIEKRIREICEAMKVTVPTNLRLWNLRGHATDAARILPLITLEAKTENASLTVIDPIYKLLGGRDENSARDMSDLMNAIEKLAVDADSAVAFGSHFAKGNASSKEAMDRISGSGVLARDPDSIITLTAHEQPNCFAVEMTLRNFPPQEPFVVRRLHPLMVVESKLDPAKLKKQRGKESQYKPDDALKHLGPNMGTAQWMRKACEEEGFVSRTFHRLKKQLESEGKIVKSAIDGTWLRKC